MRLEIILAPELLHAGFGKADMASHRAHAPAGAAFGRLGDGGQHPRDFFRRQAAGTAGPGGILQARQPFGRKTPPPLADRAWRLAEFCGDSITGMSFGGLQHDGGAQHQSLRRGGSAHQGAQLGGLRLREFNVGCVT